MFKAFGAASASIDYNEQTMPSEAWHVGEAGRSQFTIVRPRAPMAELGSRT